jgi:hypothetical protein
LFWALALAGALLYVSDLLDANVLTKWPGMAHLYG